MEHRKRAGDERERKGEGKARRISNLRQCAAHIWNLNVDILCIIGVGQNERIRTRPFIRICEPIIE